ncbi:hypothetical protein GF327_04715 [Candidatus Woesearchaeota archaeon]|nr:hypothetical protein [Candidatus Woesearchaeota archaeon]
MLEQKVSGILLPISSLPGKHIGNFGKPAFDFINHLVDSGQSVWQVLPMGPIIEGDSPFYSPSTFALNPYYIDLEDLVEKNLLTKNELSIFYSGFDIFNPSQINYEQLWNMHKSLLQIAYNRLINKDIHPKLQTNFSNFQQKHSPWLNDYANFMGIKQMISEKDPEKNTWFKWDDEFKNKEKFDTNLNKFINSQDNLSSLNWDEEKINKFTIIQKEADFQKFMQWLAFSHWDKVKKFANERNISIIGDDPIYVAPDSADVWANRDAFKIDNNGELECYAGVPPDYFSPKHGQFWGNPIYKWWNNEQELINEFNDTLWQKKERNYENPETIPNLIPETLAEFQKKGELNNAAVNFVAQRLKHKLRLFDELRIDHFRGFSGYWEIPAKKSTVEIDGKRINTAKYGNWMPGPGLKLFEEVLKIFDGYSKLKELPIIAEDLGVITPDVEKLKKAIGPGMQVFHFAPWGDLFYEKRGKKIKLNYAAQIDRLKQKGIDFSQKDSWNNLYYLRDNQFVPFGNHEFLPHNAEETQKLVAYLGTHDNETTIGFFNNPDVPAVARRLMHDYITMHSDEYLLNNRAIETLFNGNARYAIVQMQDILGLPNEKQGVKYRMNQPNTLGNWLWKLSPGEFSRHYRKRLSEITERTGRIYKKN